MILQNSQDSSGTAVITPSWNAVFSLALAVAALITAEFLPVSLLTPMARDLHITEGLAGQTISFTAIAAMITSLFVTVVTQRLDRRHVLLSFCLLQVLSNLLVVFAPSFALLLLGRILLGIGLGGFWAMSAATAMRLVPEHLVPKALSIIFGSLSIATVVAAPMGSFLGAHIGWRNVFLIAAAIGLIAMVWQAMTLPSMRTGKRVQVTTLFHVLKRPKIKEGLLATMFIFMGYATFFTYLRPFLEKAAGVDENTLSIILLGFGIANFFGTTLSRFLLEKKLKQSLAIVPLVMGILVAAMVLFSDSLIIVSVLIALWGMAFGIVQVGWPTWLTRTIADEAESAGGLQVATIQLAITMGAAFGGIFFDHTGASGVYIGSSIITLMAAAVAVFAFNNKRPLK